MQRRNKKTLVILLLAPFLVGLLSYVSVTVLKNVIGVDISDIDWDYEENEGYRLSEDPYPLFGKAVYDPDIALSSGNALVWKVANADGTVTPHAEIVETGERFALKTLSVGNVVVSCQNEKGSCQKHFNASIYDQGFIRVNPTARASGHSASALRRYGQYDMVYSSLSSPLGKKAATIPLEIDGDFEGSNADVVLLSSSDNVSYENGIVSVLSSGDCSLTFGLSGHDFIRANYAFIAVKDAYNVYSYDDLLKGTNASKTGEILCLQKNFDSMKNALVNQNGKYLAALKDETTCLFGHFDEAKQACDFAADYYSFSTTYSHAYIDTYNAAMPNANVSKQVKAGLHIQKSLYGNGFLINEHELCYPNHGKVGTDGLLKPDAEKDYFFGPLPLVTIGNPAQPIIEAYGQDNCGVYLDGDGVTLEDLSLRNANSDIANLYDLSYCGNVLDVEGKEDVISHVSLSYGRSLLRAYSSPNLVVSHSLLSTAREFLCHIGSNTLVSPDASQRVSVPYGSAVIQDSFSNFFDSLAGSANTADGILNEFTLNGASGKGVSGMMSTCLALQKYLDNSGAFYSDGNLVYEDEVTFDSVYFHQSGLFAIALDAAFNGPYLYNGLPSVITTKLGGAVSLVAPSKVGATSAPVRVHLKGDTRFYDWKDIQSVDPSSLIANNINSFSSSLSISVDDFFPMKPLLEQAASSAGRIYTQDGKNYLNTIAAYYGGGLNLSSLIDEREAPKDRAGSDLSLSFLQATLEGKGVRENHSLQVLTRCVSLAMGFHPFRFVLNEAPGEEAPAYFGETPAFSDLLA